MTQQPSETASQGVLVRPIIIDVRAWLDTSSNRVQFEHEWRWEGGPAKNGRIDIDPGTPATPLRFQLRDETGLRLRFKDPASEAMWVSQTGCPKSPGNGGQITYDGRSATQLRVTDANSNPKTLDLVYALRFDGDKAANGPPFVYDPEIRNGGTGSS